jgi:septum site-determining protein MinC
VNSIASVEKKKSIRFNARSFVAFALAPEAPLEEWLQGLDRWTEHSPGFFNGRPVVLNLKLLDPLRHEIAGIVDELSRRGIRVYAIEANGVEMLDPELPPLLTGAKPANIDQMQTVPSRDPAPVETPAAQELAPSNTLIIDSPIRSGQSIFHPYGDVIVMGSVASGSEIIAGGSVHIYGTLRGRACAGATGNAGARIFCQRNEAELLAVDGWYRTAEDMEPASRGKPVQAFLENEMIWVSTLN